MSDYIVTVKMSKDPNHNPRAKVSGECPVNQLSCTDITGEHHSFLHRAGSNEEPEDIKRGLEALGIHVTRIESVGGMV